MTRCGLFATWLLCLAVTGCAVTKPADARPQDRYVPYDLMEEFSGGYGINYATTYAKAWAGSAQDARLLFILGCHTDGCYSEGHAEALVKLLGHLGDVQFASLLQSVPWHVRVVVVDKLLFGMGYDAGCEAEVEQVFRREFPKTSETVS